MAPVVWLPYVRTGTGSDSFTEDLAAGLGAQGVTVHLQPFSKNYEPYPFPLKHVAPPAGAEIVLANSWNAFAFARPGLRLIAVEHLFVLDPKYSPFKTAFQRLAHAALVKRYLRWSYSVSDELVAPSAYTADAVAAKWSGRRPRVIYNGVDADFFSPPAQRDALSGRAVQLLFVSSHTRRKGFDYLPQIMELAGCGFELSIAGRQEPGFDASVRFLGQLDRAGMRDAYRRADLLLMPSHLEGLSLAALEAMACGTPVVAFDAASFPEFIVPGINGMLAADGNVSAFVGAIKDAAANDNKIQSMREAARATIMEKFTRDRTIREYLALMN